MILLCDEDIGSGVPTALRAVGYQTISMGTQGWLGRNDIRWLQDAGQNGWLAFSSNKRILKVPEERNQIITSKVGIIFLTSGEEHPPKVLRLLLTKWEWLELVDRTVQRPFAFFLQPNGRTRQVLTSSAQLMLGL